MFLASHYFLKIGPRGCVRSVRRKQNKARGTPKRSASTGADSENESWEHQTNYVLNFSLKCLMALKQQCGKRGLSLHLGVPLTEPLSHYGDKNQAF